jgi:hypothetical protein
MNDPAGSSGAMRKNPFREPSPSPLRLSLAMGVGIWLVYLAFLPPGMYSVDANSMLAVSESVVTNHSLTVPADLGAPGRDGRIYSTWYPLLSILAVPFAYAGLAISRITGLPFHYLAAVFALVLPAALTAASASIVALLSLRMGGSWRGAWLASLSYALSTVALVYARTFFADPLLAFLTILALYLALGRTRPEILGAACLAALAILAKPTGIVVGPILSAYLLAKRLSWRQSVLPFIGTVLGFGLFAIYNDMRFGSPLNFGKAWTLFRLGAIPFGVLGLLASPGWGLIWYCPAVVLAVWGFRKASRAYLVEALAIVAIFLAYLLLNSYELWYAGWAWGPRYLLPAIPGLCALTGLLEGRLRKLLVYVSLIGFLINAPTLFSFYERYYAEMKEQGVQLYPTLAWSPRLAPFLHGWPAAIRQVRDASRTDVKEIFAQRGAPSQTIEESRALRIVALWWWVLPVAHVPRLAGLLVAILLFVLGCVVIVRAARASPSAAGRFANGSG